MLLEELPTEIVSPEIFDIELDEVTNTVPPDTTPETTAICWVAREVYGVADPRWMTFREWLLGDAPAWFRALYIRRGEGFAQWLAPHASLKSVIRAWMNWIIRGR